MEPTVGKCSFCKNEINVAEFGLNRNQTRNKKCPNCVRRCEQWRLDKQIKQQTFDWEDETGYATHPLWEGYAATANGWVLNLETHKVIGKIQPNGYVSVSLYTPDLLMVLVNRFIWECFNGPIVGENLVVDHIDNNPLNNEIDNLQLITGGNNQLRAYNQGRRHQPGAPRPVLVTCVESGQPLPFNSISQAGRSLGINPPSIQFCAEGITNSCHDKRGHTYTVRYQ